jgi:hypothetical protein
MNRIVHGARNRGSGAGRRWGLGLLALAVLMAGTVAARAQNSGQPQRAVRLSYVYGQVQITQNGQAITEKAVANMPLFQGYQVITGQDGRAEVQFEDGSVARIAPNSGMTLSVLRGQGSNGEAEIDLNGGLGYFELQSGDQAGQIRIRYGNAVVTASGFTVLRIDMDTPPGALAVFSGNARLVDGQALTLDLHSDETLTLNAANPSAYELADSIKPSSWDQWNADRDQALQAQAQSQTQSTDSYVNSETPAWNNLNDYGNWYDVPGQGYVWSPYAAAYSGWDPYGCGQWVWTPGYGYIWVSCYQWGFMPYQCGMWNYYSSFGWGWSPGFGGCTPWWYGGYSGYYGYLGPNIGVAPSGYRPVLRPPRIWHHPRGRFPRPVMVDRNPRERFNAAPLRSVNGPAVINGRLVHPVGPARARTNGPGSASGFMAGGGGRNGGTTVTGGQIRVPMPIYGNRRIYTPAPRVGGGQNHVQPRQSFHAPPHAYSPPRTYAPPRAYTPPRANPPHYSAPEARRYVAPRSYSAPRTYSAPSRPAGGGFHGGGAPGGGYHGGAGGFHGGGGGAHGGGGGHR